MNRTHAASPSSHTPAANLTEPSHQGHRRHDNPLLVRDMFHRAHDRPHFGRPDAHPGAAPQVPGTAPALAWSAMQEPLVAGLAMGTFLGLIAGAMELAGTNPVAASVAFLGFPLALKYSGNFFACLRGQRPHLALIGAAPAFYAAYRLQFSVPEARAA